jgi:pimeloyl-[acyl-carrier protein] methyl ester esterase
MVTLVLLPGMDGTGTLFEHFCEALGADLPTVIVDYPGNLPLDYQALEHFARERLPTGEPYVLMGESFSGPIAISLAESKPAGLLGLILCCTFARNPVPLFRPMRHVVALLPISTTLTALIAPILLGRFSSSELRSALRRALDMVSSVALRKRLGAVLTVDYSLKMANVAVPVLYLRASEDRIVPAEEACHIKALCPLAQVLTLDAPHMLLQTRPVEAAAIVRGFVRDLLQSSEGICGGPIAEFFQEQPR